MEMEHLRFPVHSTMMLRDGYKVRLSGKKLKSDQTQLDWNLFLPTNILIIWREQTRHLTELAFVIPTAVRMWRRAVDSHACSCWRCRRWQQHRPVLFLFLLTLSTRREKLLIESSQLLCVVKRAVFFTAIAVLWLFRSPPLEFEQWAMSGSSQSPGAHWRARGETHAVWGSGKSGSV